MGKRLISSPYKGQRPLQFTSDIVCQLFLAFRQISDPKSERAFGQCSANFRLEPIAAGREGGKALDKGL